MKIYMLLFLTLFISQAIFAKTIAVSPQEREFISKGAKLSIHAKNGEMAGYRLRKSKDEPFDGSLYDKMGLRIGDVIMEINEILIDSPQDIRPVYWALRNDSKLIFKIIRKGEEKPLEIKVNFVGK